MKYRLDIRMIGAGCPWWPNTKYDTPEEADAALAYEQRMDRLKIKKFRIVAGDWLPGGDELTPTMKLKRKPISAKYEEEIEALYTN